MSGTLWYDLTSLQRHSGAASGIQRAAAGLAFGLRAAKPDRALRFCEFQKRRGFRALGDDAVDRTLDELQRAIEREASGAQRAWARLRRAAGIRSVALEAPFGPGDVLFNPGFSTYKPRDHDAVEDWFRRARMHYVGFVYDLLPVLFPEWWRLDQQARSRTWFTWTGRNAALVLCCSRSTCRDASRFFADAQIDTGPIEVLALGDELSVGLAAARSAEHAPTSAARPFVLYVSTLEVRKNHRLLFQVWRRLIAAHGSERVPDLVFVGRRGWLVDDFVTELEQSRFLGGKIVWRERVDDAELARLYESCLFTVYPSLYEGWGLPVAEALSFGKCCVASSSSSLSEVGGDLVDYHDPHDVAGATALIERAIFDTAFRAAAERRIRERFRPRSWRDSAVDLLARIERLGKPPQAQRESDDDVRRRSAP